MNWTAKEIRKLRRRFGWTRKKFAVVMKVAEMTIYRWETGLSKPKEIYVERLGKLAALELNGVEI